MKTQILTAVALEHVSAGLEISQLQLGLLAANQSQKVSRYRNGHNVSGGSNIFSISFSLL